MIYVNLGVFIMDIKIISPDTRALTTLPTGDP